MVEAFAAAVAVEALAGSAEAEVDSEVADPLAVGRKSQIYV